MEEFRRCNGEDEMTFDDFDVRSIVERTSIENLSMEEDWRRVGRGLEEGWRRVGGALEEDWRRIG